LQGGLADELVKGVPAAAGALMEFFLEFQQGAGLVVVELEVVVVALQHGAPSLLLPLMKGDGADPHDGQAAAELLGGARPVAATAVVQAVVDDADGAAAAA
jgi:hypothetical protein